MKTFFFVFLFFCMGLAFGQRPSDSQRAPNLILITADGLRWQEIFNGPDKILSRECPQCHSGEETILPGRESLMPFVWNIFRHSGRLYGNRSLGNYVDTRNFHQFSYPGYTEMLCGEFNALSASNKKSYNKQVSVLEVLNRHTSYRDRVAVFSSWEVFPYILNEPRSGIMVNAGWEEVKEGILTPRLLNLNRGTLKAPRWKGETRFDDLTWQMAIEYTLANHPKVLLISLDDTDRFGHQGDYCAYLEAIRQFDRYLEQIWDLIQGDPFYKGNTYLLVSTDHGRGATPGTWNNHGFLPLRSGEAWYLEFGPGLEPGGEIKSRSMVRQESMAGRIAAYCGIPFKPHKNPFEMVLTPPEPVMASNKP